MNKYFLWMRNLSFLLCFGCTGSANLVRVEKQDFGTLDDGKKVELYTLRNKSGASTQIMSLGATIVSINVPDRNEEIDDIALGFDDSQKYMDYSSYFGAIVGRFGNRIRNGKFSLDGKRYQLAINNAPNSLHGGEVGFDKRIWKAQSKVDGDVGTVVFSLVSDDGEEGFPGKMDVIVSYSFDDDNRLTVEYTATTSEPTVLNLTQHSYFNLDGHAAGSIESHHLQIFADTYTPVDSTLIPTGEIESVVGTPMDFLIEKPIGRDISADFEQIEFGMGYDHNWVLGNSNNELQLAATAYSPGTGRELRVYTDQPGVQFYSGNFLDGSTIGKGGVKYIQRSGFCLETQHFPDSPNQPDFPSTVLRPGETFHSTTVFDFGTR